ncbi:MAG: hypothetical protein P9L92_14360 [Candidatus Electryonea clarkiae]|nr:hypothetical protein [Candidatus Electryonea clarkiae]MDP8286772.1 hypothetical protein [Candidatus Electryonea clarkiae]
MKFWSAFFPGLYIILLLVGCSKSSSDDQPGQVFSPDGILMGSEMTTEELKQKLRDEIDDLGIYHVIVTDVDGWDIRLREARNRTNRDVVTYRGSMAYYSGPNYYEGTAAGVWDYENNIFSCTCLDSSWRGGHINYVMPFVGYSDLGYATFNGPYYYMEEPHRVDRINAWVYEGEFRYLDPDLSSDKARPRRSTEEIVEYLSRDREVGLKTFDD